MYVKPCIKDILRIGGQQGRYGFLRLDMNENPGGLPLEFVEEVKKELTPEYLAMYPEESRIKKLLADYLTGTAKESVFTEENLCLTNGSDMCIRYLYEVFAEPGSTVVTVAPSFEMYRIYAEVFGLKHRPVQISPNFEIPVEEILNAIQEDTDIVVLLNPNNPIGRPYTEEEFARIADRAAQMGALLIVDEAYHYFYKNTFLDQVLKYDHVVVLRTFSKLLSLAGCRMGYMVSNPKIIEYVRHVRPSFEVNSVALKFGERLLERPEIIDELQQKMQEGKDWLVEELRTRGYEVDPQEGNFIFVKPRHKTAKKLGQILEQEKQVLVKTYGNAMLRDYLRVSIGEKKYMKQFVDALLTSDR
ncbi:MAG: pyridoxal phosphate-dependent aminotransferase [Brotaphodocola sp.]